MTLILRFFSGNLPFNYDAETTKYYLSFKKEKTAGKNFVIRLADDPIVEDIDESSSMYFLPTNFKSKAEAEKLVVKLKENFDQDYYDRFVSFGLE